MQTPKEALRALNVLNLKMVTAKSILNDESESLMKNHGPNSRYEYSAETLAKEQAVLHSKAADVNGYEDVIHAAQATLDAGDEHFSRAAILHRAKPSDSLKHGKDDSPELVETRKLNANLEFSHRTAGLAQATDEQLVDQYTTEAVRDVDLPMLSMLLNIAEQRGGLLSVRIKKAVDSMPLPEAEDAEKHLEQLGKTIKDMQSAHHYLQTGQPDKHANRLAAVSRYQDSLKAS